MGRPRNLANIYNPPKSNTNFSEGAKSKGILDDHAVRQSIQTRSICDKGDGKVGIGTNSPVGPLHVYSSTASIGPLMQTDLVNGNAKMVFQNDAKYWQCGVFGSESDAFNIQYLDSIIWKKGLEIDTSGNVTIANGTLDMNTHKITNVVDPTANQEVATKKYVDDNDSDTTYTGGTNLTLSAGAFNVDDAFLKNDAADVGVGLTLTGDNSSADTAYVPMVLYNTDATPPAASGFPIGTIYIQYTA